MRKKGKEEEGRGYDAEYGRERERVPVKERKERRKDWGRGGSERKKAVRYGHCRAMENNTGPLTEIWSETSDAGKK